MAITYATDFVQANVQNVSSSSLTVAVNDVILVLYSNEDNGNAGTLSIAKSAGTSTVSAFTNIAITNTNSECKSAGWFCTVTGAGTLTVTVSKTGTTLDHSLLATIVHTGADTSNPCPVGNRFSGIDTNGDTTQSITPTASGSALWMIAGDWNATNSFAAAANCTLANTYHSAGALTSTVVRPTTQPRTDANAFTIGESDTGATIAWVACEIKAATTSDVTAALTGSSSTLSAGSLVETNDHALTGSSSTLGQGSVTKSLSVPLTGASSTLSAGSLAPNTTIPLVGSVSTLSTGNITAGADVTAALTGSSMTLSPGTVTAVIGITLPLTGVSSTLSVGTLVNASEFTLSGSASTLSAGSLVGENSLPLSGSAGTLGQGSLSQSLSAPLSGIQVADLAGDMTAFNAVGITGIESTLSAGTVTASISSGTTVALVGSESTLSAGSVSVSTDFTIALTGSEIVLSQGSLSTTPVVPVTTTAGGAGYPVGIYYQDQTRRKIKKSSLNQLLDKAVNEYYAELIDTAPKKIKNKAAKIVKPFSEVKRAIPKESNVDWEAFRRDKERLKALKELYLHELNLLQQEEYDAIDAVTEYEKTMVFNAMTMLITTLRQNRP